MIILGVDPGKSGALAFYDPDADSVAVFDMPVVDGEVHAAEVARYIKDFAPNFAMIERVHAMPKNGAASMFNFGFAYGVIRGVVAGLMVPTHLVTPTTWKRHYKLSSNKEESRWMAINLWPDNNRFSKKKDDGRAEAALLAKYGFLTVK
jgi:crossover junction endodeoxyribonuclease RuvC